MLLIQEELRKELEDIQFSHKNEINALKDETEKEQTKANELEDTFSQHILNMNEKQTDMQTEIHNLRAELKHLQVEYDSLKNRYEVLVQTNDVTSGQNTDLKNDLEIHSDQINVLNKKIITMATEISKKDQEIDFLKNQNNKEKYDLENRSQQNRSSEDLQETGSALHEEIKTLRKNLDEAKNEVKELHKEKENYSSLSDALSNELQALKEELENQHSFAVFGNTTLNPQEKTIDEMQELEIENKTLKDENKLLQKQIKGKKDKVPNFSSEDMIQEVVLQPMAIESMETMPVGNSSHFEREKKMYIDELKEKENHINELKIQIKQLSEELMCWKDVGDVEETSKIIQVIFQNFKYLVYSSKRFQQVSVIFMFLVIGEVDYSSLLISLDSEINGDDTLCIYFDLLLSVADKEHFREVVISPSVSLMSSHSFFLLCK